MEKYSRKTTLSNLIWRFLERCGAQGVTFIVSIILARLLDPVVYGTVALVTVFNSILQVFIDSGMGSALIQKKNADDIDFSSVFYFNIFISFVLYGLMFVAAPVLAHFYNNPDLISLIRVSSLTLLISGIKNVQQAYVSRNMMFKRFFYATLGGTIGAAFVGIWMAYQGFGAWALVTQNLFNMTVDTVILWFTVKWRPIKAFSFKRLKNLFDYGWKLLVSGLLDTVYNDLQQLIIGKKYTYEDLAYLNRGQAMPNILITNINASINSVLLPVMSSEQDNRERVKSMTRRSIKTSTYIIMPMMMGLAVCAEPLVRLLLTEKWLSSVFFMRIFCFIYAFYPIHTANLSSIKAMGRSDLFLKLEIIKKMVGLTLLFSTVWISVEAMAYSLLVSSIISQIINSWPNKNLLNYCYTEQLKDILPQIILSVAMGVIVYSIQFVGLSSIMTLIIQIPLGMILYWAGSKMFRIDSYTYILSVINEFKKQKR